MNEKMKQARIEKNLSQTDLAKNIGVSRQTINMIENGVYNPTIELCIRRQAFSLRISFPRHICNIFYRNHCNKTAGFRTCS